MKTLETDIMSRGQQGRRRCSGGLVELSRWYMNSTDERGLVDVKVVLPTTRSCSANKLLLSDTEVVAQKGGTYLQVINRFSGRSRYSENESDYIYTKAGNRPRARPVRLASLAPTVVYHTLGHRVHTFFRLTVHSTHSGGTQPPLPAVRYHTHGHLIY